MISGIYAITNTLNKKTYFGSSYDCKTRFRKHKEALKANRHCNPHLQAAWNKYGEDRFVFKVVLLIEKQYLLDYEQRFIASNPNGYNIAKDATAPMTGRKHTEECKAKMRERMLGNNYGAGNTSHTGQSQPAEVKEKIGKALKGNKHLLGHKHTEATKEKIRQKLLGNTHLADFYKLQEAL